MEWKPESLRSPFSARYFSIYLPMIFQNSKSGLADDIHILVEYRLIRAWAANYIDDILQFFMD